MAKLKGKLKASTLLEVIVAMVVIMIVFVLATGIYANVMRVSPSVKQQRIKALMTGLMEKSITEGNWQDELVAVDSLSLQKTVVPYGAYPDLLQMEVIVLEQGKEIAKIKQVVKVKRKEGDDVE